MSDPGPGWTRATVLSGLYLASAGVGVWAAPHPGPAGIRFALLCLGVALVHLPALWRRGEDGLQPWGLGAGLMAAGLSGTILWRAAGLPTHPALHLQPNAAGGALAVLLPLAAGAWALAWQRRARGSLLVLSVALAAGLPALGLAASRGAWLGLGAGTLAAFWLWRHPRERQSRRAWWVLSALWLFLGLGFAFVASAPGSEWMARWAPGLPGLESRLAVWRNMAALLGDYPYTGAGLGATAGAYSAYVLLVHVPYLQHAHNLFLQMALEQGIPGLLVFVGLVEMATWWLAAAGRSVGAGRIWRPAVLAALVAMVCHGFVDAELYVSTLAPLLFLPIGLALAVAALAGARRARSPALFWRWGAVAVTLGLVVATLALPRPRAALRANLGAVAQSRAELGRYAWPAWPVQDAVRRSHGEALIPALTHYRAALALDPGQASANRRLGQIELSLGQYGPARGHLEAALRATPHHRAARQMLGESYVLGGDGEAAGALWRTLDLDLHQLEIRQHWYASVGEREAADLIHAIRSQLSALRGN